MSIQLSGHQRFNRVVTLTPLVLILSAHDVSCISTRLQFALRPDRCLYLAYPCPDLPPDPRGQAAQQDIARRGEDGHARMSIDNKNLHIPHARICEIGGELVGLDDTNDLAVVETQLHTVTFTIAYGENFPQASKSALTMSAPQEVITVTPGFCSIPAGISTGGTP